MDNLDHAAIEAGRRMCDAALGYLARGWSVLPLCPPMHVGTGREHRGCGSPGKRPYFPNRSSSGEWKEFQTRRATEAEVREWFAKNCRINLGIALGPVSGMVGIDVDDEDGERLLEQLSGGDLPRTWEFETQKGRRLLYRLRPGQTVITHSFKRPGTEIEILKILSHGSQTVAPPSVHKDGATYRWKALQGPDDIEPADAPEWMRDAKIPGGETRRPADGELITEGGRNNYLISLAGAMRKRGADEPTILAALTATNEGRFDPPLAAGEVESVARSAMRYAPDEWTAVTIKFPEPGTGAGPKDEPEPKSADDVAGIEDLKRAGAAVKWLWPNWVQRGVLTAVAAEGGTGKTRLTADLVSRIRHRRPWPDGSPMDLDVGPTVALWVVSDNHHDEMVSLCDAFGISDCVRVNAHPTDPYGGVTLELLDDFALLEKRVKLVRPAVVVVDTVGNATDKNLSRQEDAKAFYQPLQLIARRQNVAILCLTHLNAGGKVLGRRALEKVRTCLRMSAETVGDHTCRRRLEVTKSNSKYPPALGVTMGDAGNEYDDNPPPPPEDREPEAKVPAAVVECRDWLLGYLKDNGATRFSAVEKAAKDKNNWAKQTVLNALDNGGFWEKPGDKGRFVKVKDGRSTWYMLPGQTAPEPIKIYNGERFKD